MNEAERDIRHHLIDTLEFLSSVRMQREFAASVLYDSYDDEFACWWLDEFYPDEPSAEQMFTSMQRQILVEFTQLFESNLAILGVQKRSIDELHRTPEWQTIVHAAEEALHALHQAA